LTSHSFHPPDTITKCCQPSSVKHISYPCTFSHLFPHSITSHLRPRTSTSSGFSSMQYSPCIHSCPSQRLSFSEDWCACSYTLTTLYIYLIKFLYRCIKSVIWYMPFHLLNKLKCPRSTCISMNKSLITILTILLIIHSISASSSRLQTSKGLIILINYHIS